MRKIKKDDEVIVIAGRDKGRRGSVDRVLDDNRIIVKGVNLVKRHTKADPNNPAHPSGIVEKEAPIQISNIAIYNNKTDKADRVGIKITDDGRKVRIFRSTGDEID